MSLKFILISSYQIQSERVVGTFKERILGWSSVENCVEAEEWRTFSLWFTSKA